MKKNVSHGVVLTETVKELTIGWHVLFPNTTIGNSKVGCHQLIGQNTTKSHFLSFFQSINTLIYSFFLAIGFCFYSKHMKIYSECCVCSEYEWYTNSIGNHWNATWNNCSLNKINRLVRSHNVKSLDTFIHSTVNTPIKKNLRSMKLIWT